MNLSIETNGICVHCEQPALTPHWVDGEFTCEEDTITTTPSRIEKALRNLIADIDYDHHKYLECDESDGSDHYPALTEQFIKDL